MAGRICVNFIFWIHFECSCPTTILNYFQAKFNSSVRDLIIVSLTLKMTLLGTPKMAVIALIYHRPNET